MANRRNYKTHSTGLRIFCVILALVIIGAVTLGGLQLWGKGKAKPSNWGKKDPVLTGPEESIKYETVLPANGGMTLPEKIEDGENDDAGVKSNGIALMSAPIPVAQYAAYDISPAAETARTVTATVSPDNEAPNTKIKWELSWKDPASEWATGKEVSDYVTLQTNADDLMGSKTCTVSCRQAFGEQIILKAIAVEDETKFATCNVDYVRQAKSASASIGDVSVNLGGNTDIPIAILHDYGGMGGEVTVTPVYSDTYTIDNEFTATASLTHAMDDTKNWLAYSIPMGAGRAYGLRYNDDKDIIGDSIYFDRRIFTQFEFSSYYASMPDGNGTQVTDDGTFTSTEKTEELASKFSSEYRNKVIWTMKVTLTSSTYSYEYTYESDIVWTAIMAPVSDVQITPGDILFP